MTYFIYRYLIIYRFFHTTISVIKIFPLEFYTFYWRYNTIIYCCQQGLEMKNLKSKALWNRSRGFLTSMLLCN